MIKVEITKKIKNKKMNALMTFLYNLSVEICFTTFHNYYLDENFGIELINEYKKRCIEKHRNLKEWYINKEPFLLDILKKLKIKTDEEFEEYKTNVFNYDMSLVHQMNEILIKLQEEKEIIDYKELFPALAKDYKGMETHFFDTAAVSILPLDILVYNKSEEILKLLINIKDFKTPVLANKESFLINTLFCNEDEGFAMIFTEQGTLSIVLKDNEYLEFKKLKIKHKKEYIKDEENI